MAADRDVATRRSALRGVSVEQRQTRRGPVFIGRYTLATRRRPSLPGRASWEKKVNRARYRYPGGGSMTFAESHLGDGTGRPRGNGGGKAEWAARHALLTVFGPRPPVDIGPQDVGAHRGQLARP